MSKSSTHSLIRLRGVRHNNLKNFDLDLPLNQLIVITGVSGSGKSSLAFDTLFAEGQRRYIETFSPYARQFFDRMDKPQVDRIEGIPPAIAIEQRNSVKSTRSTVGTMTEVCDYLKLLWPHIARLHCRQCGRPVRKDSPQGIWQVLSRDSEVAVSDRGRAEHPERVRADVSSPVPEVLIAFDLALTEKLSLDESLSLITKQGYQRLLLQGMQASQSPARHPALSLRPTRGESVERTAEGYTGASSTPEISANPPHPESSLTAGRQTLALNEGIPPWGGQVERTPALEIVRVDEAVERLNKLRPPSLTVVQDRTKLGPANRARFVEACEQAYHFGKGRLTIHTLNSASTLQPSNPSTLQFSNRLHCALCDIEYREPTPPLFSFNHPVGACPACRGFGRIITIDYDLAIPDRSKTLAEGAVRPWQSGVSAECQRDLMKFCRLRKAPTHVPFEKLPKKWRNWVIEGDPGYGQDKEHEWPRAWYGVKGYFRWLESKAYKMHVRVLLSRYRSYTPCPDCHGKRFQPEALLYKVDAGGTSFTSSQTLSATAAHDKSQVRSAESFRADREARPPGVEGLTLADFYQLPVRDALRFVEQLAASHAPKVFDPLGLVLGEVRSRLGYLAEVGLGYLTLDRPTRSLSGGETERVNLTTCLGTRLVNTLYVLDEPSVGLHPRDTGRLIGILEQLRNLGNAVVVVEHEASVIRAADQIVDLGPGHGEAGGQVVFQGTFRDLLQSSKSLTGQYLSGRKRIEIPKRRPVTGGTDVGRLSSHFDNRENRLTVHNAALNNLQNITVEIPLGRFVCVTGVSGSGKTTLVRDVLLPALEARLKSPTASSVEDDDDEKPATGNRQSPALTGAESLGRVVLVDQSPLGKTPRSNPAVYIGAFDDIRELFAQSEAAKQRGLNASAFSFNSTQGQCERCRGAGFEKIEMQFLSDVFIRCPDCHGRRYRAHILEVKVSGPSSVVSGNTRGRSRATDDGRRTTDKPLSIADLLDATVDEAIEFLESFSDSRHAQRAVAGLKLLQEVGLGYLRLGQPINTLSGGESQRLKLVSHLAEVVSLDRNGSTPPNLSESEKVGERVSRTVLAHTPTHPLTRSLSDRPKPALFLFDEPTTGLHFDDVRILLNVFQRLVDAGHSVLVIEHNLEVIKCADWMIDLGPEAGDEGGQVVACGTPEQIAACAGSHTGRFLREIR